MNRHSLTWADHAKFRLSFRHYRREYLKRAATLAVILAGIGIASAMDYRDALLAEAMAQERDMKIAEEIVTRCLSGGLTGLYITDGHGNRHYEVCDSAWTVSDENVLAKDKS